jgi:hypothetical protein
MISVLERKTGIKEMKIQWHVSDTDIFLAECPRISK